MQIVSENKENAVVLQKKVSFCLQFSIKVVPLHAKS